jgi:Cytochrome c oxidase subunit IV
VTVEERMLWWLSLFFFLIGLLYWLTAYEPVGVTLLMLCSGAAIVALLPYRVRRRRHDGDVGTVHHLPPSSSLWPFLLGAGAVLVVNGFILGPWLLVPGAALVLRGLVGVFSRVPASAPEPTVEPAAGPPPATE